MPFLNRIGSGSTNKFGFRMGFSPGAPTSVTASLPSTYGNTTASVSWTAPVMLGSPALNDYVIQYSSDSGSTFTTFSDSVSTSTSVTVTGLTNGTAYVFRVAAKNTIGTGAFSSNSNSVTPLFGKLPTPIVPEIPETTSTILWCYSNHSEAYTYNYYDYTAGQPPNDQIGTCHGWTGLGENVNRFTYVYVSQAGWANSDPIYLEETTDVTPPPPPDPCAGSPAAGTVISGNYCSGTTLVRNVSDGCNGSTVQTVASNSATCGYVPPDPCAGVNCATYNASPPPGGVVWTGGPTGNTQPWDPHCPNAGFGYVEYACAGYGGVSYWELYTSSDGCCAYNLYITCLCN